MRIPCVVLALAWSLSALACSEGDLMALFLPREGDGIKIGSLVATESGVEYAVYVGLPDSYAAGGRSYPVAIMTDGDWDFRSAYEDARRSMREGDCGEFILVGLGYGEREDRRGRDYTPTRDPDWEAQEYGDEGGPQSGGADEFLAFMADELLPYLELRYRITPGRASRCLAGHSLGGLLALYASVRRPELFGQVVASSPSLYWDRRVAFSFLDAYMLAPSAEATFVFGSIGAQEGFPNDVFLQEWLRRVSTLPGHETRSEYFPDTVHTFVQTLALPAGLVAAFGREVGR